MDKNEPRRSVSRSRVEPINIDSIYIDFRCYTKQQDGESNHNHSPNRNTSVEPSKSADDSSNKKENHRKNRGDFNMRRYVAEKNREQYAKRGELFSLQLYSNEAPANMDECPNTNEAPVNLNESLHLNEAPVNMDDSPNTNEAPGNMDESPHSNDAPANMDDSPILNEAPGSMDESPHTNKAPAIMDNSPNLNEAPGNMNERPNPNEAPDNMDELPSSNKAPANMDKSLACANKLGTENPSSIHNTNVTTGIDDENRQTETNPSEDPKGALSLSEGLGHMHIGEENAVATEVWNTYLAFIKNWVGRKKKRSRRKRRKLRLLSDIYQNAKPIGKRTTTTFQVVNVIEDFKSEDEDQEECSNIRIRRRKHAKKAIDINEGVAGKK